MRVQETRPPKINLHEGENERERDRGRRKKGKSSKECKGKHTGEREKEGSACVCSGLKTAQFLDSHLFHAKMKLMSGNERLTPWRCFWHPYLHNIAKPERSREILACFLGEDSGTNFAR